MMAKGIQNSRPKTETRKTEKPSYHAKWLTLPSVCMLLAAAALLLYSHTLKFELGSLDEDSLILKHANLYARSANLPAILSSDPFLKKQGTDFYRPLQNLSYFLDTQFFGPQPFGYRLSNLIIHWLACCALFSMLTLLSLNRFFSLAAALFYCVHPLFTCVAWMPSRADLLLALLLSLSVVWLLRYMESRSNGYLALHLAAFALAIAAKETAAIFPLLVLYIVFVLRSQKGLPRYFLTLVAGYALTVALYLHFRNRVLTGSNSDSLFGIQPLLSNLAVLPESVAKFVLPWHLSLMSKFSLGVTLVGCAVIAVLLSLFVRALLRKHDTVAVGGLGLCWFLVFSIPGMMFQLGLVNPAYDYLEHRTYLPNMGLVILLLSLLPRIWNPEKIQSAIPWVGAALCVMIFIAYRTSMAYENSARFFAAAIEYNPGNVLALYESARVKTAAGNPQGAIQDLEKAIHLRPNDPTGYCMRGTTLGSANRLKEALADLNRCLELKGSYPEGYFNRALVYARMNDFRSAAADLDAAIRLRPEDANLFGLRGSVRKELADLKGACEDWRTAAAMGDAFAGNLVQANCR